MSRALSLTSSFFSAAFVVLLVLGLLVLGGPVVADEPLGPPGDEPPACAIVQGSCPLGITACVEMHCCYGQFLLISGSCCICQDTDCVSGEVCEAG